MQRRSFLFHARPTGLYVRRPGGRSLRLATPRPAVSLLLFFAGLITIGTFALLLPFSTRSGHADLVTALFTSTSAVCVTGLGVVVTGTYWSGFGQAVILILMQVGGLGFMIGATALALLLRRRVSLRERVILQETGALTGLGGLGLVTGTVLFALVCETVGALLLWARFAPRFGLGYGLWLAVFHSVSAFTNGSFDLFPGGRSLADFRTDPAVLLTIAALLIVGGLSFVVVQEVTVRRRWRRLSLDTRVILLATPILLLGGTLLIFITEHQNPASIGGLPLGDQLLNAFFHSAAARTAGFSTWDFSRSDPRTLFFLLGLMFIGGAPGSMAGGIKITTAAAILAGVWATLHNRVDINLLNRRVPLPQLGQALAVSVLALGLILNVALVISLIEGDQLHAQFLNLLFDVTSAFGTVGFSTGVTAHLSAASKLLLVLTMFVGRLGPVTFATALTFRYRPLEYHLPHEPLRIG